MKFILLVVTNALALAVATWLLDDITLAGSDRNDRILNLVIVGAILGVINSIVRPVVKLLSLPLIILTLGLMLVVINALMLLLTSRISAALELGFHVEGFWTAVLGGIVISISTMVIDAILPEPR
ncbi:MAG TPA: phage holin family protein [Marmoricola sp.]|jgi:putative membrane protein|nr:phage holin family protein [Marmoricola sp.]